MSEVSAAQFSVDYVFKNHLVEKESEANCCIVFD